MGIKTFANKISVKEDLIYKWHRFLYKGVYYRACFDKSQLYLDVRSFGHGADEWNDAQHSVPRDEEAGRLAVMWMNSDFAITMKLDAFVTKCGKE